MKLRSLAILMGLPLLAARGHDIRFDRGSSGTCVPFDAVNRHVVLEATLNDHPGMRMILDTGAGGAVLDGERAAALGLEAVGTHQSLGAGGLEQGSTVHGVDVVLPGLSLLDQTMGTLPLGAIAAQSGAAIDGILGHSLLARCVVEIDYPRHCVSFFDPAGYTYAGSGVVVPLTFKGNLPYVKAAVVLPDGRRISGKFVIDTGASSNVLLSSESVERESVSTAVAKTVEVQARGVGGLRDLRLARLARLELGGSVLEQPVAGLQPAGVGRISAPGTVGNIGGGVLSRFKVIFDYSRRRMILEPGPEIGQPFEADMSGLGLVSIPPEYRRVTVMHLTDDSPALEAGVKLGDEIVTVNGTPVGEIGLSTLRERFRVEGQNVKLELLRGEKPLTLEFKTRRMV
jgi:predicted aspartyl protease